MRYVLKDIVGDTYSNASGVSLFIILDNSLMNGDKIELSFMGSISLSSSFLNSSFGELIDKHGFKKVMSYIKLVDLTKSQATYLKKYFSAFEVYSV